MVNCPKILKAVEGVSFIVCPTCGLLISRGVLREWSRFVLHPMAQGVGIHFTEIRFNSECATMEPQQTPPPPKDVCRSNNIE